MSTRTFFEFFIRAYPGRTLAMVALMVTAGFAESIGVLTLVPVLEVADRSAGSPSTIGRVVLDAIRSLGLTPSIGPLLLAVVVAITIKAILLALAGIQSGYATAHVSRDLRLRLIRALLYARWSFFGQKPLGAFANAVGQEVNRTAMAYQEACQLLASLLQVLAYLVVSLLMAWQITATALVVGTVLTIGLARNFRKSHAAGVATTTHNRALSARLIDVLQGMKPLKAMAREALVWPLLRRETDALNRAQRAAVDAVQARNLSYEPVVTAVLAAGLFGVLTLTAVPLAQVLVLAFIFYRIMQHINTLQMRYQSLRGGEAAFHDLMAELRRAESAQETRSTTPTPLRLRSEIVARDLHFSFGTHQVLAGVDIEIPAGTFVTIAGESGSGKTTLADLLVGLRTPDSGEILVDGTPLAQLDPTAWRQTIGYVPQEMLVFNDTILNNVTLGDERIPTADVEEALRLAGAWTFVQQKPEGLRHPIGERGSSLSGGQRQRIALARALVTRPSLLILDEVTTALDPATEQEICATLRGLRGHTTILAISHQAAIRDAADRSYHLRGGTLSYDDQQASKLLA